MEKEMFEAEGIMHLEINDEGLRGVKKLLLVKMRWHLVICYSIYWSYSVICRHQFFTIRNNFMSLYFWLVFLEDVSYAVLWKMAFIIIFKIMTCYSVVNELFKPCTLLQIQKKCPNACMIWLPRLLILACILSRHHAILCKIESYINWFSRLWLCLMCM